MERRWWQEMGAGRFPRASKLMITADGGGSNGSRNRLWDRHGIGDRRDDDRRHFDLERNIRRDQFRRSGGDLDFGLPEIEGRSQHPALAKLAARLKVGGYMHCATDWEPYAEQILEVLSQEPRLRNTATTRKTSGAESPIPFRKTKTS